jgi:hypothetical protein
MCRRARRNHAPGFKAKVADVHPNQITTWKAQLGTHQASPANYRGSMLPRLTDRGIERRSVPLGLHSAHGFSYDIQ